MPQKVFVLNSMPEESDLIGLNSLITNYWGALVPIKFLAHKTYLTRLTSSTGYLALKVTKIKKPDKVDARWQSFDIDKVDNINSSFTSARYFVISQEILDEIYTLGDNINCIAAELGLEELPNGKKQYSVLFGAANFKYVLGGGGTTPGAGAKVP